MTSNHLNETLPADEDEVHETVSDDRLKSDMCVKAFYKCVRCNKILRHYNSGTHFASNFKFC